MAKRFSGWLWVLSIAMLTLVGCGEFDSPVPILNQPGALTPRPHPGTDPDPGLSGMKNSESESDHFTDDNRDSDGALLTGSAPGNSFEFSGEEGLIRCGTRSCVVGSEKCVRCEGEQPYCTPIDDSNISAECTDPIVAECDGHEDCSGDKLCHFADGSNGGSVRCLTFTSGICAEDWAPVCRTRADCGECDGVARCVSQPGLNVGRCQTD